MENLGERLTEVMQELGIATPRALAAFCGVSEGLVSQWFSGRTKLGAAPLTALARTEFSLDWIMAGKLPKYRKSMQAANDAAPVSSGGMTPDEILRLLSSYGQSTDEARGLILTFCEAMPKRADEHIQILKQQ